MGDCARLPDAKKVAIFGGSYGGYAALAGVTFTPEKFACAVDNCGPSNIRTLFASYPPYWKPKLAQWAARVGDVNDPKDAELIKNASPLFKADKIQSQLCSRRDFRGCMVENMHCPFRENAIALRVGVGAETEEDFAGVVHLHGGVHL